MLGELLEGKLHEQFLWGGAGNGSSGNAQTPRQSFTRQTLFQVLTTTLRCEVNTLGYPRAALFVFAVALVAANTVSALRAAIRSVHGGKAEAMLSTFYIVASIQAGCSTFFDGFGAAIVAPYARMTKAELVIFLQTCARHINLAHYRKAPTKPKRARQKKRPPAPSDQPHVSTARILAASPKKRKYVSLGDCSHRPCSKAA